MTHAASSLCVNFDLTIGMFNGCSIPVLNNQLTKYLLFGIIFLWCHLSFSQGRFSLGSALWLAVFFLCSSVNSLLFHPYKGKKFTDFSPL